MIFLLWLFGIIYAVVTFLAPFFIMGINDKMKETNKLLAEANAALAHIERNV